VARRDAQRVAPMQVRGVDGSIPITLQWLPAEHRLLFEGDGLGVGWMRRALDLLLPNVTARLPPATSPQACSDSSDSPPFPPSVTTASTPSPSCSNARSGPRFMRAAVCQARARRS